MHLIADVVDNINPMKNKTQGKFRLKEKIPRETCISVDHPRRIPSEPQEEEHSKTYVKHGFSSEYLSLARRFKISILANHNQQRLPSRDAPSKTSKLRLKTEMSKLPRRYPGESPIQLLDAKPHSLSIPDRTVGRPFFLGPRSTALSTQIPQGRAQDLQLLGMQPETGLKLASK